MSARYAIYYTPAPESALWQLASAWLGRDAHTDRIVARPPEALDIAPADLTAATATPARYGFHATLVAPFELAAQRSEAELTATLATLFGHWPAFRVELKVERLDDFIALVPARPEPRLDPLAAACVRGFDAFRAPLSAADFARRDTPGLSESERSLLKRWGYPHVFDAFRFHMSLTGALPEPVLARLQPQLTTLFDPVLQQAVDIASLSLLKQTDRGSPFSCVARQSFSPADIATKATTATTATPAA